MTREFGDSGIHIGVYNGAFGYQGNITRVTGLDMTLRRNEVSTCSVRFPGDHWLIPEIIKPGARLVVRNDYGAMMSGYVDSVSGAGPDFADSVTVAASDDFSVYKDVLGWVVPNADITQQGSAGEYDRRTGPAETMVRFYLNANAVERLGLPIAFEADQRRGPDVTAALRFHPLYDRLFPVGDGSAGIDGTNLSVHVEQRRDGGGKGLIMYCTTPQDRTFTVSESTGSIREYKWSLGAFQASRAVVLGAGEGVLRVTRNYMDATREAAAGGRIRERVRDARDLAAEDAALLAKRGQEVLDEGAATASLSMTLSETAALTYGSTFRVGDIVKGRVGPTTVGPAILGEVDIKWNRDDGEISTPKIGDREDDPDAVLISAVQRLARRVTGDQLGR